MTFEITMMVVGDPEHNLEDLKKEVNDMLALMMPVAVYREILVSVITVSRHEWD